MHKKVKIRPAGGFHTLPATHQAQDQEVKSRKGVDDPFTALGIDAGDGGFASHALHDDYLHANRAGGAEEVSGAGGGLDRFSLAHTGEHFYHHHLLAQPGAVALQIILYDLGDDALFKCLPLPGHQFGFLDLIDRKNEKKKKKDHNDRQAPSQKEMRPPGRLTE